MRELIQEYKSKQIQRLRDREKMAYKFESGKIINLAQLEKREISKGAIFDYYKHKHFLEDFNQEAQAFLFITFTLNPQHNKKDNEEDLKTIQRQNSIFENYFSTITKHNKTQYIKIKELTKKGNIHLHTLFKIAKSNLTKFIDTLEKQRKEDIGIINIKTEKNILEVANNPKDFLKAINFKDKKALVKNSFTSVEANNYIKKGSFIELEELEQFEANNVKNYILKYIKKNIETNENNESKEHIIFKIANIRKLTTSQMIKKESKKDFLSYYYFCINHLKNNIEKIKEIDLIAKYENNEYFKEWEEWKTKNKQSKPKLLNLTQKRDLEEYLYNQVHTIEERQEGETLKSKAILEVIKDLDNHLTKNIDIQEIIKEEYIIQKELFEKEEERRFLEKEELYEKILFKQWLRELRIGLKQYIKMSEEELSLKIEERYKRRRYTKKIKEVCF